MDRNTKEPVGGEKPTVNSMLEKSMRAMKHDSQLDYEARLWFEELEAKQNLREMEEFYESQKGRREAGCSMWEA